MKLTELFSDECEKEWSVITPTVAGIASVPSRAASEFTIRGGCPKDVRNLLQSAFIDVLCKHSHGETFWEDFILNATHLIGLTHREHRRVPESSIVDAILNPLMRRISMAVSIIPENSSDAFYLYFLVGDSIKMGRGLGGQPAVDAAIQIDDASHRPLSLVPVEMKPEIIPSKHFAQIAAYMNKASTAIELSSSVMTSIIIDVKHINFAFSPIKFDAESGVVPLPVVYISPPITWKEGMFFAVPEAILIIACMMIRKSLSRLACTDDVKHLIAKGQALLSDCHILYEPDTIAQSRGLYTIIENQQKKREELDAKLEKGIKQQRSIPPGYQPPKKRKADEI